MNELKQCPFCGGNVCFDKLYSYFRDDDFFCAYGVKKAGGE